jgi:hypothetical protein
VRRFLLVPLVLALLVSGAGTARAAVPADEEAWILGAGLPVRNWELQYPGHVWTRTVTVRSTGAIEGREGNRHTAYAQFWQGYSRFPIQWTVRLTDEQCNGTACTTVWAGESNSLPQSDAVWDPIGSSGAVHVRMPLRGSSFHTTSPAGAPVAFDTSSIDVTVTPVGWSDPRATPRLADLPLVTRSADTTNATVTGQPFFSGEQVTAEGTIAGVAADELVEGSWSDLGVGAAQLGAPLPALTTTAQLREYAPPLTDGRFTARTTYELAYTGVARGTVRTTTGVALKGNAFRLDWNPMLNLEAGDRPVGEVDGSLGVTTFDCPQATSPLDDCTVVESPDQFIGYAGRLRYAVTPLGSAALWIDVPVTNETTSTALGALRVMAALTPTGPGFPERSGTISHGTGRWQADRTLQRTLTGQVRLGGLVTTVDRSSPNLPGPLTLRISTERFGPL